MKVQTLKNFNDLKAGRSRTIGEVFIVSKARFEEIQNNFKNLNLDPAEYIVEFIENYCEDCAGTKEVKASKR